MSFSDDEVRELDDIENNLMASRQSEAIIVATASVVAETSKPQPEVIIINEEFIIEEEPQG